MAARQSAGTNVAIRRRSGENVFVARSLNLGLKERLMSFVDRIRHPFAKSAGHAPEAMAPSPFIAERMEHLHELSDEEIDRITEDALSKVDAAEMDKAIRDAKALQERWKVPSKGVRSRTD